MHCMTAHCYLSTTSRVKLLFVNEYIHKFTYTVICAMNNRGEYRLAKPYRDILRYGDSVLRYVLNMYWIASKGIEMDF